MDEQPRLTDLVPTRWVWFLALLLAGLGAIAGLEGAYVGMPRLTPLTGSRPLAALDLAAKGSLAVWFASMSLAVASLLALLVYSVRRHKADDYYGHYRIWLWAAVCWMLLSLDAAASLREGFRDLMIQLSGTRIFGDGMLWWAIPTFLLLGAVGTRLLVDMRGCWLSAGTLAAAGVAGAVSLATQLGWLLPGGGTRQVMVQEGARLLGDHLLVAAMGLHARYVILDAQGLLVVAPRKRAAARPGKVAEDAGEDAETPLRSEVKVHPPHGLSRPTITSPTPAPSPAKTYAPATPVSAAAVPTPAAASAQRKLTKEDRKALKKKLEKLRREREEG